MNAGLGGGGGLEAQEVEAEGASLKYFTNALLLFYMMLTLERSVH